MAQKPTSPAYLVFFSNYNNKGTQFNLHLQVFTAVPQHKIQIAPSSAQEASWHIEMRMPSPHSPWTSFHFGSIQRLLRLTAAPLSCTSGSGFAWRTTATLRLGFRAGCKRSCKHQASSSSSTSADEAHGWQVCFSHPGAQALESHLLQGFCLLCMWAVSLALDAVPKPRADGVPPAGVQQSSNKTCPSFSQLSLIIRI